MCRKHTGHVTFADCWKCQII